MDIFENFSKVKILVVGDVMIDKYLWGDVSRISPEAPVPVVRLKNTDLIAGGAANVAGNVNGLGATAYLVGVVGDDLEGRIFPEILEKTGISSRSIVKVKNRQTTIKTRIVAHNQQVVRVDQETSNALLEKDEEKVWNKIKEVLDKIDVIVISDYHKGVLSTNLTTRLIREGKSRNKIILVDPKGKDYSKYIGATMLTPNKFEVGSFSVLEEGSDANLLEAGKSLVSKLKLEALLITRGEDGMTLLEKDKEPVHLSAAARNVYDVTGAGDTVIATVAVALGAGRSYAQAAEIANTAAGLVVEEVGTSVIKRENLVKTYTS